MRSHTATSRDTETPIPIGTTHKSAMTFIRTSTDTDNGQCTRSGGIAPPMHDSSDVHCTRPGLRTKCRGRRIAMSVKRIVLGCLVLSLAAIAAAQDFSLK